MNLTRGFRILLIALLGLPLTSCRTIREYKEKVAAIEIEDLDLQAVADGEYLGKYDVRLVKAAVKVVVRNHRIESIELLRHDNGRGEDAEVIPGQIVKAQSLRVDTISGATSSSLVILEAIELALKKGMQK
ncbi:MAG TPA: FMN-binding protein [Candidatus Marinimicrobia bacterium]|nr:FMN-binding protein [Candidatus Neomarinimicrobiota bacterium]